MRWFAPKLNKALLVILVLCALIIVSLVWAVTERARAEKLEAQLALVEVQIERNPLIAPRTQTTDSDVGMIGEWLAFRFGKEVRIFTTTGISMHPIVSDGGKVAANPVQDATKLVIGDFILFQPLGSPNQFWGHQIIGIGQDSQGWYAITKGTGNFGRDWYLVRAQDVKYLVRLVIY